MIGRICTFLLSASLIKTMHHPNLQLLPFECLDPLVDLFIYELTDYRLVLQCDTGVLKTHAGLFIEPLLEFVTVADHGLNGDDSVPLS